MPLYMKFINGEMSDQKKLKITFLRDGSLQRISLPDEGNGEQIILGAGCSQNATEEDDCLNWREKRHSVQERNLYALRNSTLSDITLEVGPENTPLRAHKLILALGSPVFEAMFYGPLAEKGEIIKIPDIMPDGFRVLLSYLYGDITALNNEIEALNAWIAADKYCVPKLKTECDNFFCNCRMSSSNIWKLLENSVFLNMKPLVARCKQYLEKHTDISLSDNDFLETKMETVKEVLTMSSSNVSELVLLKSVIHWGRHKAASKEGVSLADILRPLLPHIRFGSLTPAEFCQFLDETNDLLEQSDALAILKHLTQPLMYALPVWCCVTSWSRVSCLAALPIYERSGSGKMKRHSKFYQSSRRLPPGCK